MKFKNAFCRRPLGIKELYELLMSATQERQKMIEGERRERKNLFLSLDQISKVHGISKMVVVDLVRSQEVMACLSYFLQLSACCL